MSTVLHDAIACFAKCDVIINGMALLKAYTERYAIMYAVCYYLCTQRREANILKLQEELFMRASLERIKLNQHQAFPNIIE